MMNPEPRSRYPRRNIQKVCYEEELSNDEDFLFCEECQLEFEEECPVHGPLFHVIDTKAPLGPGYAWKTCPSILSVCRSGIQGAGLGVWAKEDLSVGIVFGPYEGNMVKSKKEAQKGEYAWQIRRGRKVLHYIDATDPSTSNWMRFVNCARYEHLQNLVAFQYDERIYYKTCKKVPANTELTVWYGDEFTELLGIDLDEDEPLPCSEKRRGKVNVCGGEPVADENLLMVPKRNTSDQNVSCASEIKKKVEPHSLRCYSGQSNGIGNACFESSTGANPKNLNLNGSCSTQRRRYANNGRPTSRNHGGNTQLRNSQFIGMPRSQVGTKESDRRTNKESRKSKTAFNLKQGPIKTIMCPGFIGYNCFCLIPVMCVTPVFTVVYLSKNQHTGTTG